MSTGATKESASEASCRELRADVRNERVRDGSNLQLSRVPRVTPCHVARRTKVPWSREQGGHESKGPETTSTQNQCEIETQNSGVVRKVRLQCDPEMAQDPVLTAHRRR